MDLPGLPVLLNARIGDVVDARNARNTVGLPQGVEEGDVSRRHADDALDRGSDHGAVECGGSLGIAPQDEQVLLDVGCSLPRVADGDECRGLGGCALVRERQTVGGEPAYVESRGVGRGIYGLGEGSGIEPGSAATAEAEGGQEGQEE